MHAEEIVKLIDRLELAGIDVEIARADPVALYQAGVDLLTLAGLLGHAAEPEAVVCADCGQRALASGIDPERPFRCDTCAHAQEPATEALQLFAPVASPLAGQLRIR